MAPEGFWAGENTRCLRDSLSWQGIILKSGGHWGLLKSVWGRGQGWPFGPSSQPAL